MPAQFIGPAYSTESIAFRYILIQQGVLVIVLNWINWEALEIDEDFVFEKDCEIAGTFQTIDELIALCQSIATQDNEVLSDIIINIDPTYCKGKNYYTCHLSYLSEMSSGPDLAIN